MFAIIQNGAIALLIQPGTAFTWDGVEYPSNWLNLSTPQAKSAIGLVDVVYAPYPNDTYYWVTENAPVYNAQTNQVDVTYTTTPKDLATLKTNLINQLNQTAWTLLNPSDWMVIMATETGTQVPAAWNTWRAEIRTQAANQATAINACTTVDALAALAPVVWANDPNYVPPTQEAAQ